LDLPLSDNSSWSNSASIAAPRFSETRCTFSFAGCTACAAHAT
jgi:hypothetical protein